MNNAHKQAKLEKRKQRLTLRIQELEIAIKVRGQKSPETVPILQSVVQEKKFALERLSLR